MPRSYRLFFAATVGWLILAGQSEQGWAANDQHEHQQESPNPLPVQQTPKAPTTDSVGRRCYPGADPSVSCDGITAKATVDQARDADTQAALAHWQFGVGVGTSIAAAIAAFFAWRAAHHARRSADAAHNANKAYRASAERQDRAYIAVQPAGIRHTADHKMAVAHVIVKNWGKIPARGVEVYVELIKTSEKTFNYFDCPVRADNVSRVIQPTDEMQQASRNSLIPSDIDDKSAYIFVWGVVYYEDGFKKKRFTRFCHRYAGAQVRYELKELIPGRRDLGQLRTLADTIIDGKDARHHQHGNDAD